jgi:hypothetical protein
MKVTARWLKPLIEDAATSKARLPWERGLRREAFINRRKATDTNQHPRREVRA